MSVLDGEGLFSSFEQKSKAKYVDSLPDQCSARGDDQQSANVMGESYIFGPIIVSTVLIALALAVSILNDVRLSWQKDQDDCSDDQLSFMHVPSLKERLLGE